MLGEGERHLLGSKRRNWPVALTCRLSICAYVCMMIREEEEHYQRAVEAYVAATRAYEEKKRRELEAFIGHAVAFTLGTFAYLIRWGGLIFACEPWEGSLCETF